MAVSEEGVCLCLFLPLCPPPKCCFPFIVQAVCLEKLLTAACNSGSVQPWLCWAALLHRAASPLAMAAGFLAFQGCLDWCPDHSPSGAMTQQETFPKQHWMESLTVVWFVPHFPGWGPALCSARKTSCCSRWFAHRHNSWHHLCHVFMKCVPWLCQPRRAATSREAGGFL